MENKNSSILSILGTIITFLIIFGIPGYFLWDIIKETFGGIPSSRVEFKDLLEKSHGVVFYIFAGCILLWGFFSRVLYGFVAFLNPFLTAEGKSEKAIYFLLGLLFLVSGMLPIISYLLISNGLYGYYFDFHQMISFIGTFELMLLFVAIFEAFVGTQFIAPIVGVIFYGYLLVQFL